jgi:hypothetical protein
MTRNVVGEWFVLTERYVNTTVVMESSIIIEDKLLMLALSYT